MSKVTIEYAETLRPIKRIVVKNEVSGRTLVVEPVLDTSDGFIEFTLNVPGFVFDGQRVASRTGGAKMKISPDAVSKLIDELTKLRQQHSRFF